MEQAQRLRVLSLNTWKCDGEYRARIKALATYLPELSPDVVLLQEVFDASHLGLSTYQVLARALPEHSSHRVPGREKIRHFEGMRVLSTSSLAIFVRGEILRASKIILPTSTQDPDRVGQLIAVRNPSGEFTVANVHLTHIEHHHALRAQQTLALLRVLPNSKVIVGGDFNATPTSQAVVLLKTRMDCAPTPSTPTLIAENQESVRVVDYLAWSGWPAESPAVSTVFDGERGPIVSDHLGVMADIFVE